MLSNVAEFIVRIDAPQFADIDLTAWGNYMREQVETRLAPIGDTVTQPDVNVQLFSLQQRPCPWEGGETIDPS